MPLKPGNTKGAKASNFKELTKAGYSGKQRVAIMLSEARRGKAKPAPKRDRSKGTYP